MGIALGIDFSWIFIDFRKQVGAKLVSKIEKNKNDPKRFRRFHIALGTFQEATERQSLILHWFWEIFLGWCHGRASRGGDCPTP